MRASGRGRAGELSTHFIDQHHGELLASPDRDTTALFLLGALHTLQTPHAATNGNDSCSPWSRLQGFRIAHHDESVLRVQIGSDAKEVNLTPSASGHAYSIGNEQGHCSVLMKGDRACFIRDGHLSNFRLLPNRQGLDVFFHGEHAEINVVTHCHTADTHKDGRHYSAPMNGRIVSVNVGKGDKVSEGDTLLVMEAMKMEHRIRAHGDGLIAAIDVSAGDLVSEGQVLVALDAEEEQK